MRIADPVLDRDQLLRIELYGGICANQGKRHQATQHD
jgi:hypothetical protein